MPTNVTATSNIWVVFGSSLPTYYGTQGASLHCSMDNWKTVTDTTLTAWCNLTDANGDTAPLYGLSLGQLATGTTVDFDIHHAVSDGFATSCRGEP